MRMAFIAATSLTEGRKRTSTRDRRRGGRASLALETLEPRWLLSRSDVATDAVEYARQGLGHLAGVAWTAPIDVARLAPTPPVSSKATPPRRETPAPESPQLLQYRIVFETPGPHSTTST